MQDTCTPQECGVESDYLSCIVEYKYSIYVLLWYGRLESLNFSLYSASIARPFRMWGLGE